MTNPKPSDLNQAARTLESKLMEFSTYMEDERELNRFDDIVVPALNQLRTALASGVPEAEVVRQLMALKEWAVAIVQSVRPSTKHRWDEKDSAVDAALCDAILAIRNVVPPPVAAPSGAKPGEVG